MILNVNVEVQQGCVVFQHCKSQRTLHNILEYPLQPMCHQDFVIVKVKYSKSRNYTMFKPFPFFKFVSDISPSIFGSQLYPIYSTYSYCCRYTTMAPLFSGSEVTGHQREMCAFSKPHHLSGFPDCSPETSVSRALLYMAIQQPLLSPLPRSGEPISHSP